jgi:hypothetical protein
MDLERFDHWSRVLGERLPRRTVHGLLLGGLITSGSLAETSAKRRRRKKRKKDSKSGRLCKGRCPSGCCTGAKGTCQAGTSIEACGGLGELCRACTTGEICEDQRCCRGTQQPCADDNECCGAWVCQRAGKCCGLTGDAIPSGGLCCEPDDVRQDGRCCRLPGTARCEADADCCGSAVCSPKEHTCCLRAGAACDYHYQCCTGVCQGVACA